MKNNFAIIIPTHNRQFAIPQVVDYWKGVQIDKFICDSSANAYDGQLLDSFYYHHCPGLSFPDKLVRILSKLDYKSVALCADDDFLLLDTLDRGFLFLHENDQYSFVIGKILMLSNDQLWFRDKGYENTMKSESDDFLERSKLFFSQYQQILWGIYRKDVLLKAFRVLQKADINNDNFIELTLGAILLYFGKGKILNNWLNIRGIRPGSWGRRTKMISWQNIIRDKSLRLDVKKFKKNIDSATIEGLGQFVLNAYLGGNIYKNIILLIFHKLKRIRMKNRVHFKSENKHQGKQNQIVSIQWEDIPDKDSIGKIIRILEN